MKRIFFISFAIMLSLGVGAYDFSARNEDGIQIFYNILDEKTVEVTAQSLRNSTSSYCGIVEIPSTVDFADTTYSVVGVGDYAFNWCNDLIEVVLPEGITYLGTEAFYETQNLTTINFPSTLVSIGDYAFMYSSLNDATLPDGLISIGAGAFVCCQFETITIPNTVTDVGMGVFEYCDKLKTVMMSTNVTYVPNYMFFNCENLEDVYLPDLITSIGDYAFYFCNSLSTITIPDGVKSIGDYAFYYCLRKDYGENVSLTIPESVTSIGEHAFAYSTHIGEVTILANVSTIKTSTFEGCGCLASVDIPKEVTSIEDYAFYRCSELASFTSHNPEAPICDYGVFSLTPTSTCVLYVSKGSKEAYATAPSWKAFENIEELDEEETPNVSTDRFGVDGIYYYITNSTRLTCEVSYKSTSFNSYSGSVVIPETVTYNGNEYAVTGIGYSAFRASTSLTEVTIPESITYIDTYAFYNCTALKSVSLPHGITEIGQYTFYNCTAMTESLTIPANVTYIGNYAFNGGSWKELILEDGEQPLEIVRYALNDCTIGTLYLGRDLTAIKGEYSAFGSKIVSNIIFSERITSLCDYEFKTCWGLKELVIPGHITTFGEGVFHGCSYIESVTISPGITTLGEKMFAYCTALTEVSLPEGIVEIPGAFWGCTALTKVSLPEGIVEISDAFRESGLEEVTVPGSVTSAETAFGNCSSLKKVVLSEGFSDISKYMFQYCTILEDVTFPSTLTRIREDAFRSCEGLQEIVVPEGVTSIARAFYQCYNLSYLLLPQSLTSVSALETCSALKKIVIPKQVTSLRANSFNRCSSLEEIVFLENMQTFSYTMFTNCPSLQRIYSLVSTPPTKDSGAHAAYLFEGLDTETCVLYVPVGAKETYANDENWYVFTHIEELGDPLAITYGTTVLTTDSVEITGYIAVGSVGIAEVGFEYWSDESDVKTITATVEDMKANLTDLPEATTYTYRAYAKTTTGNTIYGDNLTFTTIGVPRELFTCTVDPADKEIIPELSQITFTNPNGGEILCNDDYPTYPEFNVYDEEGNHVTIMNNVTPVEENGLVMAQVLTFGYGDEDGNSYPSVVTEEGTYYVTVPAEIFIIYDEDNNVLYNEAMTLTYTISADAVVEPDYTLVISPESGSPLESLSTISISCEDGIMWNTLGWVDIAIYDGNGNELDNEVTWEEVASSSGAITEVVLTISPTITDEGDYTIEIPKGYFLVLGTVECKAITLEYTVKENAGTETGIRGISINDENVEGIYSTSGQKLNSTAKGVTIVRYEDGTAKKILVK